MLLNPLAGKHEKNIIGLNRLVDERDQADDEDGRDQDAGMIGKPANDPMFAVAKRASLFSGRRGRSHRHGIAGTRLGLNVSHGVVGYLGHAGKCRV